MDAALSRKIFGMARQLSIDNDELHCLVYGVTGCESLRKLTNEQADSVIRELACRIRSSGTAPTPRSRKTYTTKASDGMTQGQCRKVWAQICELIELDGAEYTSDEAYRRLNGAIVKITGNTMGTRKEPFYGLSSEDGQKLIDMLKRYIYSAELKACRNKKGAANG